MAGNEQLEQQLEEAKAALHKLQMGEHVASIRKGDRVVDYTPANIPHLRAYINQMRIDLGGDARLRRSPMGVC